MCPATRKITRAMELIAASRIVKAQQRVLQSRPYVSSLIEVISNVGRDAGGSGHLLSEVRDVSTVGMVVISSDRGLAGAYNSNLIRMAERAIGHHQPRGSGHPAVRDRQEGAELPPFPGIPDRPDLCGEFPTGPTTDTPGRWPTW